MNPPYIKPRVTGDDLPNELLLSIFPHLPVASLILARGVSRRWRNLVLQSHLDPARRSLLTFYYKTVSSPAFIQTRTHILPHLQPFNRHSYLNTVPLYNSPSREFEVWIREWPEKATIGWIWPGLEDGMSNVSSTSWRMEGICNCLGHIPPHIKTVTYHKRKSELSPVIPLHDEGGIGEELDIGGNDGGGVGGEGQGGRNNLHNPLMDWVNAIPEGRGAEPIYHATTFLPVGIELPEHRQGQVEEISWLDEEDEAMMVSIELTTICVGQFSDGAGIWLVLDGRRGGERMKGWVYRGGFGMGPEDIIARSWIEYLEQELRRAEVLLTRAG